MTGNAVTLTLPEACSESKFRVIYIAVALTLPESKFRLLYIAIALTLPERKFRKKIQSYYCCTYTSRNKIQSYYSCTYIAISLILPKREFRLLYIAVALTLPESKFSHITSKFK